MLVEDGGARVPLHALDPIWHGLSLVYLIGVGLAAAASYRGNGRPERIRVAFVGQQTYFDDCVVHQAVGGLVPTFIDFRAGADPVSMATALVSARPDVVIVFRPELIPTGIFYDLDAVTVGWLTEPLPRPGDSSHPDLDRRLEDLRAIDPANFDRIVSFDPLVVPTVQTVCPVWRSIPLPVSDDSFTDVADRDGPGRAIFIGRSTEHRERYLIPIKHEFDVAHIAHGFTGEKLRELLADYDVAINLHNEDYVTFENRIPRHLAAGQLLITETARPTFGLEPGIDYVEVATPGELHLAVASAFHRIDAFRGMRLRGRRKAEWFRASVVLPRLVHDVFLDVAAFGRRPRHGGPGGVISEDVPRSSSASTR